MAKKRKTRSQKLTSDTRHQNTSPSFPSSQSISLQDLGIQTQKISPSLPVQPSTLSMNSEYTYVRHDLQKTTLITGAIILVELVLFFVVKL